MTTFMQILTGIALGGCVIFAIATIYSVYVENGKWKKHLKYTGVSFIALIAISLTAVSMGLGEEEPSEEAATEEVEEEEEPAEPELSPVSVRIENEITAQDEKITISGETEEGAEVTVAYNNLETEEVTAEELTVDAAGKFSLPVDLPEENVYVYTFSFKKEGREDRTEIVTVTRIMTQEEREAQSKEKAKVVDYKQLEKNPDRMKGEYVTFQGEIVQILEEGESTEMRVAVTKESWGWSSNDIVYVGYAGLTDYVEGDVITFYGEVYGSVQYTSQAGWDISVPAVIADVVE
jgi:hypothetical protein